MKLAIMQPYFFPYLGYFQLINAVDGFVVYDDVNYIKRGWINRNNILAQGKAELITLETLGGSQNQLIKDVGVGGNRNKLLKNIQQKYSKASQFRTTFPLIEEILKSDETNLSNFLNFSLWLICEHLEIKTQWFLSSELQKDNSLKGQDKILNICQELGATHYINVTGGKELYDRELFSKNRMELSFIETKAVSYRQFDKKFTPFLSIIDVMMFNNKEQCTKLLQEYSLV